MSELRPIISILEELQTLALNKISGCMFIVTEDNRSAQIKIQKGQYEEVFYKNLYNDEAVSLLSQTHNARANFQEGPVVIRRKSAPLNQSSITWLTNIKNAATAQPDHVNKPTHDQQILAEPFSPQLNGWSRA